APLLAAVRQVAATASRLAASDGASRPRSPAPAASFLIGLDLRAVGPMLAGCSLAAPSPRLAKRARRGPRPDRAPRQNCFDSPDRRSPPPNGIETPPPASTCCCRLLHRPPAATTPACTAPPLRAGFLAVPGPREKSWPLVLPADRRTHGESHRIA